MVISNKRKRIDDILQHIPYNSIPKLNILYRCFSYKHEEIICTDLLENKFNLESTFILRKYKEAIKFEIFNINNTYFIRSYNLYKKKNILILVLKIIKKFKQIRYMILLKKIYKYLGLVPINIKQIIKYTN